ncbi:hypothetical protein KPH14_001220, partial [Odynerus spinipes]
TRNRLITYNLAWSNITHYVFNPDIQYKLFLQKINKLTRNVTFVNAKF